MEFILSLLGVATTASFIFILFFIYSPARFFVRLRSLLPPDFLAELAQIKKECELSDKDAFEPLKGMPQGVELHYVCFGILSVGAGMLLTMEVLPKTILETFNLTGLFFFSLCFSLPAFLFTLSPISYFKTALFSRKLIPISLCILLGFGVIAFGSVRFLNTKLDYGPSKFHKALIVEKKESCIPEGGCHTFCYLKSWRGSFFGRERIETTCWGPSDRLIPGKTVLGLTTKSGFFGFEHLVKREILN